MNPAGLFIARPVATTLLTLGVVLAGLVAFLQLPVSPLPQVDFPTIQVQASLPGASPDTMAATVAAPLERTLGRIAGVTEITSSSSLGSTSVVLQFDLDRDINGAARDVQAALNAALTLLPTGLPSNPTYRKVNPAEAPILIIALTSDSLRRGQMYDVASTVLAQKLSQVDGVGQVTVGGGSLPAVRVELDPRLLSQSGIATETVRAAIVASNANRPKGVIEDGERRWQVQANDQSRAAADYLPILVAWRNGAAMRLSDVAQVNDGEQDLRNAGLANGKPAVMLIIRRQPGANVVATVDRIRALLPQLQASLPAAIDLTVTLDRTQTIRASLREVGRSLVLAVALVVLAVLLFIRSSRVALIPLVVVPVSIIGTFAVMYLTGFSLDNLSLMALTIATGFVVDDAVVVLENSARHCDAGMNPADAALRGAREVSFTVVSMSLSLIAVFIPILLMGGVIGRLFREFAITLSAAILVSMVVSLTTTPTLCARLLRAESPTDRQRFAWLTRGAETFWRGIERGYGASLDQALNHRRLTLLVLAGVIGLNIYLYVVVPKGFFPRQDTGALIGSIQADQSTSFQAMRGKLAHFVDIVKTDPAVQAVVGFTGGSQINTAMMFITLKPLVERRLSADQVIGRLRGKLAHEPGANLFLQATQDIRVGGRSGNAQYQYTLQADTIDVLRAWEPLVRQALSHLPELADVSTDQQDKGRQTRLIIDRDSMARLGFSQSQVDATLNDLFGQRLVSTIYNALNQYRVVMEAAPAYWQSPESLRDVYLIGSQGAQVPLAAIARWETAATPLAVNHQGQFPASTISFNLPEGVPLSRATEAIDQALTGLGAPATLHGNFQGTAKAFRDSLANQPLLILAALVTVYIVLGILYESLLHPLTILSTLPSAGVGALLALMATKTEFSVMALIGIILLIGIVKKNAIMMIDFALQAERHEGLDALAAIREAARLRLRPILMTTLAALFGALPLAVGAGDGAELRQPLGIAVVGGLILSQLLTLYTTPVVYLSLEQAKRWLSKRRDGSLLHISRQSASEA